MRAAPVVVVMAPVLLAALLLGVARWVPTDTPWGVAVEAILRSTPRWTPLIWVWWGVRTALLERRWRWPGVAVGAGLVALGVPVTEPARGEGFRLVASNINAFRPLSGAIGQELASLEPDVLVAIEQALAEVPGMVRVAHNHSSSLPLPSRGMALFCREGLRCQAEVTPLYGPGSCQMPVALARVEAHTCVIGLHSPPPVPFCVAGQRPYMEWVASHLAEGRLSRGWGPCQGGDPAVLAGDFNAVPGSPAFQLLADKGFEDRVGWQGVWAGSWPAGGGWPWMPVFRLDHVLAGAVGLSGVHYQGISDSDHRAVVAWISPAPLTAPASGG